MALHFMNDVYDVESIENRQIRHNPRLVREYTLNTRNAHNDM